MAASASRILVVEHSLSLVERILAALEERGLTAIAQPSAATALRAMQQEEDFDLFIIDTTLPGTVDGYELCRCLRLVTQAPILMISDRNRELDKIVGFELGANDYLAKPFSDQELCARVNSLLLLSASSTQAEAKDEKAGIITASGISLDESAHTASFGQQEIALTQASHAVRVAIDEEGVTAAAYTVMMAAGAAMPPEEEIDFRLDRPFLFVITSPDNLPMFVGVVNDPA